MSDASDVPDGLYLPPEPYSELDDSLRRIVRCADPDDPWAVPHMLEYALLLKARSQDEPTVGDPSAFGKAVNE